MATEKNFEISALSTRQTQSLFVPTNCIYELPFSNLLTHFIRVFFLSASLSLFVLISFQYFSCFFILFRSLVQVFLLCLFDDILYIKWSGTFHTEYERFPHKIWFACEWNGHFYSPQGMSKKILKDTLNINVELLRDDLR